VLIFYRLMVAFTSTFFLLIVFNE